MINPVHHGDCLEVMRGMEADSVDAIVTDPPYGLTFMGKDWDHGIPGVPFWEAALRVAKPGAHLLAFGGTRTFHRLACAIEDAGWEIRDCVMWVYGSGFPKSLDVSKAIDKAAGINTAANERWREADEGHCKRGPRLKRNPVIDQLAYHASDRNPNGVRHLYMPDSDAARQWQGWGTALKPAWEPIILARKPLIGTIAENVLRHGCGGLNIDGCRVGTEKMGGYEVSAGGMLQPSTQREQGYRPHWDRSDRPFVAKEATGRWPANLIHDGSEEVVALFPKNEVSGSAKQGEIRSHTCRPTGMFGGFGGGGDSPLYNDTGSAARFFQACPDNDLEDAEARRLIYCAKASKADREGSTHPTMKPTKLMRILCRLITPPNGLILDPFAGSGSTGKAAVLEGFRFVGIEQDAEYVAIAEARIRWAEQQPQQAELF